MMLDPVQFEKKPSQTPEYNYFFSQWSLIVKGVHTEEKWVSDQTFDLSDLVSKLRAFHHASQTEEARKHLKFTGLDLMNGEVKNNKDRGVFEPEMSKIKSLKFATEAAITILRIDDLIKLEPEAGDEKSYQQAYQSGQLDG